MQRPILVIVIPLCTLSACSADSPVQPALGQAHFDQTPAIAASPTVELVAATPLPLPSEHLTRGQFATATDVNDAGKIVGWTFVNLLVGIATVWNNGTPSFLGFIGDPYTRAYAVSANGRYVVGSYGAESIDLSPARWVDGAFEKLVPGFLGLNAGHALGVNDLGQSVGYYTPGVAGDPSPQRSIPALWNGTVLTDLLSGESSGRAYDINNAGQIAGRRTEGPFLWQNGVVTPLPSLAANDGVPVAINEAGTVAGISGGRAVRWKSGAVEPLSGIPAGVAQATDVNDFGQIVGEYNLAPNGTSEHAFFWQEGVGMIDLGPGRAEALNNRGIVVGRAPANGPAMMWTLNFAPVASVSGPNEALTREPVTFTAAGSTDQNGDPVTYTWNFGDHSRVESGLTVTHEFKRQGTFTVTVTARDPRGLEGTATATISVEKAPKDNGHGNPG
jgi:probable HAF family extracellular repeat protein